MKKLLIIALAAAMFVSPVMSTAAAVEPIRQEQIKENTERGPRRGPPHRGRGGRRYRGGSSSAGWVAAGILGAAVIGSAIASSNRHSSPSYVYESPTTVVVPSNPTYVYPPTDSTVYTYDSSGNLVPLYGY